MIYALTSPKFEKQIARHYQCIICKQFIVAYGEIGGEHDLCESQDCLAAWALISTDMQAFLLCHCRSFAYPHLPEAHRKLRGEWDWRTPEERHSEYREDYP